jgi:hypothetical protein
MAMSWKHYTETANVLKFALPSEHLSHTDTGAERAQAVYEIAEGLADMFGDDNPSFNRARFLEACGLGDPNIVSFRD